MFKKLGSLFSPNTRQNPPEPLEETVGAYRAKFETSLIGKWSQATGTFGGVHDEVWEFSPDHTGKTTEFGPFDSKRDELLFIWKEVAPFVIACKVTQRPEDDSSEWLPLLSFPVLVDDYGNEVEDDEEVWETILYDFMTRTTDTGDIVVLYEVGEDGQPTNRFWESNEQLALCGGPGEGQ